MLNVPILQLLDAHIQTHIYTESGENAEEFVNILLGTLPKMINQLCSRGALLFKND